MNLRSTTTTRWRLGTFALLLTSSLAAGQQSSVNARVEVSRAGHVLKDSSQVVVWLTPIGATSSPPQQQEIPKLVQRDKAFHPSLVVVPVGGKVEFPNRDPFFHNVFSLFEGKRFDLGLYERGSTRFVQFDKPGVSYIFCNIHAQMSAVVVALATPYYSISDVRGDINIPNVPPGRYEVQVFHPSVVPDSLRALTRQITIGPGDTSLGTLNLPESSLEAAHKNKYGRDYDRPEPDSPAYVHP
jgi:plastocyanin